MTTADQDDDNPFIRPSPWGKPAGPSQPHRLGPLPKSTEPAPSRAPPAPAASVRPAGTSILSGSLIPRSPPAAPGPGTTSAGGPGGPAAFTPKPPADDLAGAAPPLAEAQEPAPAAPVLETHEALDSPIRVVEPGEPVVPSAGAAQNRPTRALALTLAGGVAFAAIVLALWMLRGREEAAAPAAAPAPALEEAPAPAPAAQPVEPADATPPEATVAPAAEIQTRPTPSRPQAAPTRRTSDEDRKIEPRAREPDRIQPAAPILEPAPPVKIDPPAPTPAPPRPAAPPPSDPEAPIILHPN